jgi:hypothetical protein
MFELHGEKAELHIITFKLATESKSHLAEKSEDRNQLGKVGDYLARRPARRGAGRKEHGPPGQLEGGCLTRWHGNEQDPLVSSQ